MNKFRGFIAGDNVIILDSAYTRRRNLVSQKGIIKEIDTMRAISGGNFFVVVENRTGGYWLTLYEIQLVPKKIVLSLLEGDNDV